MKNVAKKVGTILVTVGVCGLIAIGQWMPWIVLGAEVKKNERLSAKVKRLQDKLNG